MSDASLRLDGNSAAGLLSELFTAEMTTALGTCARCGATGPLGAVLVYAHAPGTVMRCPDCDAILACLVRARGGLVADLAGLRRIQLPVDA
jgi:hypothetical protein